MKSQEQCNLYKNIINNINDAILVVDYLGNITFVNKSAINLYRYSFDEFLNMTISQLMHSSKFLESQFKDNYTDMINYKKDNSSFFAVIKYFKMQDYIIFYIRERTKRELKEKENKNLASIVESSDDAILAKDINGIIYSWNTGAEKIYGYKRKEILGKHISIVIPEESDDSIDVILDKIKRGEKIDHYETIRKRKDGAIINVSVTISPVYDEEGNIFGASTIARDITGEKLKNRELASKYEKLSAVYEELTATEEELRANYKELEMAKEEADKANKAKSQFLANMSHEIRTPMNGILGVTQLLEFTELNKQQMEYLEILKVSSHHLLDIINNILDISKIESGKFQLNFTLFNIRDVVDMITKEISVAANKKGIEIMYYLDPFIKQELFGDVLRLNQILINLMNNAIKFTERGHVYLKVKKIYEDIRKVKLEFSVEDTGIGIEDDFKDKIFKIFTQAETTYTKNYGGTGLGLAISKELVNMMSGDIWFESETGKGSIFYFTAEFSLGEKYVNDDSEKCVIKKSSENSNVAEDSIVLIVEDNEINKKIISSFLKQLGCKYLTASNGQKAIDILENKFVKLILMDIQMPILNGYDTTKIIRKKEINTSKHIPIIAMTAYAMIGDREKFIESGMDEYISKPFSIAELENILKKYCS
ncbi:PAS domain S-box protein [Clostridium pasteurianum]|uniref:PAS domain S-box protein n=1 Tax=Clostridium pasteurianum TaxID=1501 RepID=UPI0008DBD04A|nr:PAS domain S-box protein [Clostridium pasteurianum]AOZ80605.1 histidine kinase [Clostridium pasteurianum]